MSLVSVLTREGRAMVKARFGIAAASVAVLASGLLTAGIFAATTAGAATGTCPSTECSNVLVAPPSATAGASQLFTVTVTNETHETLRSVQVTAPSGFVVNGVSGGIALFQNLDVLYGHHMALSVSATVPCSAPAESWTVKASEMSPFANNVETDDFEADTASLLSASVTGSCSLAFDDAGQPNGTVAGSPITNQLDSTGSPVMVDVRDGNGTPMTSSTAAVTVAIDPTSNPGSGTLSGTTSAHASGGVAPFADLSINQTGSGYRLVATSPGIRSATSAYFDIWGVLQGCSGGSCSGSSSTTTTTGNVTTSSAGAGQFLGVGLGGVTFSCGSSYKPLSDPLSFDVLSLSGSADSNAVFSVTLQLSKDVVKSSGHPGASSWQICFGSDRAFTALPGTGGSFTIGTVTYQTGLLPDCSSTQPAPCVQSRNKTNAGVEVVTFLGTGDAYGKM
ncbi:MAG TPA: hypothetical protein VH520_02750 [Streptosporangiaceae bacterium]